MSDATTELRGLLEELARAVEWQAELGACGVPTAAAAPAVGDGPAVVAAVAAPVVDSPAVAPEALSAPTRPVEPAPPPADRVATERPEEPLRDLVAEVAATPEPETAPLTLEAIREELGDCERCKLCSRRKHIVYGVGNPQADLMFVGEAPGADEDRQGIPFVGRAGQLLTRMIGAMGLTRDDVYIANIIKCRPPQNRDPEQDEIIACEPFLLKQIDAIQPQVIVSLGRVSAQTLLRVRSPISRIRGRWRDYHGVKLMPTFHPAYLLRSPDKKREAWDDLQAVMKELGLELPTRP